MISEMHNGHRETQGKGRDPQGSSLKPLVPSGTYLPKANVKQGPEPARQAPGRMFRKKTGQGCEMFLQTALTHLGSPGLPHEQRSRGSQCPTAAGGHMDGHKEQVG